MIGKEIIAGLPLKIFPSVGHKQYVEIINPGSRVGIIKSLTNYGGQTWVGFDIDENTGYHMFAPFDYETFGIERMVNDGQLTREEANMLKSTWGLKLLTGSGIDMGFLSKIFAKLGLAFLAVIGIYLIFRK